jgi:hypothetical protein
VAWVDIDGTQTPNWGDINTSYIVSALAFQLDAFQNDGFQISGIIPTWVGINTLQSPGWATLSPAGSPAWGDINIIQTPNWTPVIT